MVVIIIAAIGGWLWYNYQITVSASADANQKVFEIKNGSTVNMVSQDLFDQGLIKSKFYFETYIWLNNLQHNLVQGRFYVAPNMNVKEIVGAITKPGMTEKVIRIQEGWNLREIAAYLDLQSLVNKDDFYGYVTTGSYNLKSSYDFLQDKPNLADLEGYLFPDTYYYYNNSTIQEITEKMLKNFGNRVDDTMRAEIAKQNRSLFEVVTLASILEKEVMIDLSQPEENKNQDMRMVADIFLKRLKDGMPLQSDATINYLLGSSTEQLTVDDLKIENPYNTYLNKGLPPGPIDNPSLYAIKAAIYPIDNPYYYFLTTRDGKVIYAKTYDEHLQNKKKYLDSQPQ